MSRDGFTLIYAWAVKFNRPIRSSPKGFIIGIERGKFNNIWSDVDQCWVEELHVPWTSGYE